MAQLSLATSEQQVSIGGGVSYSPSPIAAPVSKPVNDLIPVSISFPVLKPAPAGTTAFEPAGTKPGGCGGGSCPLAQPPAGGTVTITRSDMAPGPTGMGDAGLSFLTRIVAGLPLWIWLLILFLALVAITK